MSTWAAAGLTPRTLGGSHGFCLSPRPKRSRQAPVGPSRSGGAGDSPAPCLTGRQHSGFLPSVLKSRDTTAHLGVPVSHTFQGWRTLPPAPSRWGAAGPHVAVPAMGWFPHTWLVSARGVQGIRPGGRDLPWEAPVSSSVRLTGHSHVGRPLGQPFGVCWSRLATRGRRLPRGNYGPQPQHRRHQLGSHPRGLPPGLQGAAAAPGWRKEDPRHG